MDGLRDLNFDFNWTPMAMAPMAPMLSQPPAGWTDGGVYTPRGPGTRFEDADLSSRPPEAWKKDDPADSLYNEARKALTSNSYRRAAELFRRIRDQYPKSTYTPDAPYWEAFALQRLGNESDLRAARDALAWQMKEFPKAATRGDATTLATSIDGALARRGDSGSYDRLVGQLGRTTSQGCARDEEDERVAALNALSRMDSAQFLPVLKKVLARRETCTQALRRTAVWLYARSKASDAPQVLMNVARTDPDKEVRDQAVFWMANVPTEEAVSMLIDLAKSGSDLELRKRAVYALSRSKSTRATATLRDIAADANMATELRMDALQWYMSSAGKTADDAMSFLRDVYGKADDQRIRERTLQLIAGRRTDEAREFLTNVAQNTRENIDTRRHALSSLQSAGATAAQVAAIYDRGSNDIEIRKQAIGVLASLKDNAGVDKLLDVARNEKNLELRKQAVSHLTRTKDPRAIALLQEIILR
jgi:HEAT repeat protein